MLLYIMRKIPGQIGIRVRRSYYSRYWGHRNFIIHENVLITGFHDHFKIGNKFQINPDVKLFTSDGSLEVGDNVFINHNCFISADRSKISIGDNCLLANNVSIWCSNHDFKNPDVPISMQKRIMKPVTIGKDVWCGSNSVILPGISIGSGSIVAAGSVVAKDVPPFSIVAGNPARVIKERSQKID